jgi:Leucine-rich repeat (LRR) protein
VYSPALGERDTRLKPYCDWWPDMTMEKLEALNTPGAPKNCESIPGVVCDEAGHVTNIIVNAAGLRGPLPPLEALTHLEVLELPNNRLTGAVPPLFSASTVLRELELSNNDLTGALPCPAVGSELRLVAMSHNRLSGALPACYFTRAPQLQILSMSKNDLDATFPPEIVQATRLAVLYLDGAGLRGELALIGELRSMGKLDLSHNFLTGELCVWSFGAFGLTPRS